jgi:hypothetical protein
VRRRVAEKNKEIEWLHRHGPEVVGRRHSPRRLPTRKAQPQTDHSRSRPRLARRPREGVFRWHGGITGGMAQLLGSTAYPFGRRSNE